ncbi:hypothetical protein MJG53_004074 [Ovis ammon polii x Ovis aries]|uniref:Uncharacterized protein n=1 Tax=Ovis ammon polii x Ovis aries TaxID=2918886 RepID=A0ACB9V951_9CETA|nr:hypothetical protein MJG53_004074 [Ovis ammon polii x Ovis aries]
MGRWYCRLPLLLLFLVPGSSRASESNFELPDNAKQCFHGDIMQGTKGTLQFQEALKSVIDHQTHFRLREAQGRSSAEDLNTRVAYWLVREALILLAVSIAQVLLLKSFFSDKRTRTTCVES